MTVFFRVSNEVGVSPGQECSNHLVGGLEHFSFFHILGIIIPTDELIFFRGIGQPPTRCGNHTTKRLGFVATTCSLRSLIWSVARFLYCQELTEPDDHLL